MTLEELKSNLIDNGSENVLLFDNPDYADAFIGLDTDNRAVYSYSKMKECLIKENMTEEEAIDFIDYNTIGSLNSSDISMPIIVYDELW